MQNACRPPAARVRWPRAHCAHAACRRRRPRLRHRPGWPGTWPGSRACAPAAAWRGGAGHRRWACGWRAAGGAARGCRWWPAARGTRRVGRWQSGLHPGCGRLRAVAVAPPRWGRAVLPRQSPAPRCAPAGRSCARPRPILPAFLAPKGCVWRRPCCGANRPVPARPGAAVPRAPTRG
uniref:GntR family transcriptional regulator n=1 Tax=Diaphorobacter sp. PCA039 TaxID=266831 RepID=C0KGN2_9BURK|nr:GntR family transcriptional regulator [Diaphorobacter sp. PCA039]